jgi:hypothetical protein
MDVSWLRNERFHFDPFVREPALLREHLTIGFAQGHLVNCEAGKEKLHEGKN